MIDVWDNDGYGGAQCGLQMKHTLKYFCHEFSSIFL